MFCSKCGTELTEGVSFCPKCGTSINLNEFGSSSDPINVISDNQRYLGEEIEGIKKKETKWFLGATIAGAIIPVMLLIISIFSKELFSVLPLVVMMFYIFSGIIYGIHCFHPIKRLKKSISNGNLIGLILFATLIYMISANVAVLGGLFYWYPRAIFRYLMKKPLLSDMDIQKLAGNGLL
jgi:hypothetical protein